MPLHLSRAKSALILSIPGRLLAIPRDGRDPSFNRCGHLYLRNAAGDWLHICLSFTNCSGIFSPRNACLHCFCACRCARSLIVAASRQGASAFFYSCYRPNDQTLLNLTGSREGHPGSCWSLLGTDETCKRVDNLNILGFRIFYFRL